MARKVEPETVAKEQPETKTKAEKTSARKVSGATSSASKTRAAGKKSAAGTAATKTKAAPKPVAAKAAARKKAAKAASSTKASPKAPVRKTAAKKKLAPKPANSTAAEKKPTTSKPARASVRRQQPTTSPAEDALAVEAQNRRYYDAFQSLDIRRLGQMWWRDETVSCVHPGWDMRRGWLAVRSTYEEIFQGTRSIRFALGDVRVRVVGEVGYVTCIENLVSDEGDHGDYLGAVLATNIFERRRSEWRLVHHHASPFSVDEMMLPHGPLH